MKRLVVRIWITLLLVALMGYTGASVWRWASAAPPPTITTTEPLNLASYTMTERSGEKMSFEKLRGEVWVGSMFFSSCPAECLKLNKAIAALQHDPHFKDIRFVSITVDPATDTPATLREYANMLKADPKQWLFMTGTLSDVARLGKELKVAAGYKEHMSRLLLFDRKAKLRGMFQFDDGEQISALRKLVPTLVKEPAEATQAAPAASPEKG